MAWGKAHLRGRVILSIAVLIVASALFLLPSCTSGQGTPSSAEAGASADATPDREFPSYAYNSAQVLQAYETAVQIPEVLLLMPCYCGCGEAHSHEKRTASSRETAL